MTDTNIYAYMFIYIYIYIFFLQFNIKFFFYIIFYVVQSEFLHCVIVILFSITIIVK